MAYKVILTTQALIQGTKHPELEFETLESALAWVADGMDKQWVVMGPATCQLGDGTIFHTISDEELQRQHQEDLVAQRSGGLVLPERYTKHTQKLVVQLGRLQLPPFDFESEEEVKLAVEDALFRKGGRVNHCVKTDHDYFDVITGPGTIFLNISKEEFAEQRRLAVEMYQRAMTEQIRSAQQSPSKIIFPGGKV